MTELTKSQEFKIIFPDKPLIRVVVRKRIFGGGYRMSDLIKQITSDLQKQIDGFKPTLNVSDMGVTLEAGDGIARVQ